MPFGCRYQFAVIIQRDHNLNAPPWASSMSDSEQITPPQLGCCQQEASWPVSCTYLPLHLLSRVHALELPLHFPEPEDKVMLLFVVFFAFWIIPMILTLSTSCSSRLKVTQQRELKKYYRLLQKQFTRKTRSSHRKTQAEYQSLKISNVHTANARPHFNVYQRMLQGENKIQIPSSPDHQHTFPFPIHTFPIHFSHISNSFPTTEHRETQSQNQQGTFLFLKEFHQTHAQRSVFTSRRSSYQNKYTWPKQSQEALSVGRLLLLHQRGTFRIRLLQLAAALRHRMVTTQNTWQP